MNRQEKALAIDALKEGFSQAQSAFLVNYKGMTVKQLQQLRRSLQGQGSKLKVTKARLMRIAAEGSIIEPLIPYFKEQIGVVLASKDTAAVAKTLSDFAKNNEALGLVAGCYEQLLLDVNAINRIGSLPPREILLAQLCGVLKAPASRLVNVLNQNVLRLLWTLNAVAEKKKA